MTPPRRPTISQTSRDPLTTTPPKPSTRPGRSRQPKTRLLSHLRDAQALVAVPPHLARTCRIGEEEPSGREIVRRRQGCLTGGCHWHPRQVNATLGRGELRSV